MPLTGKMTIIVHLGAMCLPVCSVSTNGPIYIPLRGRPEFLRDLRRSMANLHVASKSYDPNTINTDIRSNDTLSFFIIAHDRKLFSDLKILNPVNLNFSVCSVLTFVVGFLFRGFTFCLILLYDNYML